MCPMGGSFVIVPASVLLALSFFVLAVVGRSEKPGMRNFGLVVATLLWLSILVILGAGLKKQCPMMKMMDRSSSSMMQGGMMPPQEMKK